MNTNPKNCQNRLPAKGGTLTQKQPRTIKNDLKSRFFLPWKQATTSRPSKRTKPSRRQKHRKYRWTLRAPRGDPYPENAPPPPDPQNGPEFGGTLYMHKVQEAWIRSRLKMCISYDGMAHALSWCAYAFQAGGFTLLLPLHTVDI